MRLHVRALSRLVVALGLCLAFGCTRTNEENLGGQTSQAIPHKEGTPDFKTYAEYQQYQAQQAAKDRPAGKGKAAPKAAAKDKATARTESPKSP